MKWFKKLMDFIMFWKSEEEDKEPEYSRGILDMSNVRVHTTGSQVLEWEVVSKLCVTVSGGKIHLKTDRPEMWRAGGGVFGSLCGELWAFVKRDGVWHGGPCDGVHQMPSMKESHSACVPDGDYRRFVPQKGETVKFRVSGFCRGGRHMKPQQWTEECDVVWPYEAQAPHE